MRLAINGQPFSDGSFSPNRWLSLPYSCMTIQWLTYTILMAHMDQIGGSKTTGIINLWDF
ncbi:TPA: hypothetical protein I0F89_RS13090 [Enterococcus faecalis]|nr:hypothetical protein [Enterococcus faecalis]